MADVPGIIREVIEWHPSPDGGPLGRHQHWDPRSLNYQHEATDPASWQSRLWHRHVGIYDQGSIGDCTSESGCGCLSTGRFGKRIRSQRTCQRVYHAETLIDGFGAPWPPNDRGSSGLAFAQVAKSRGWVSRYEHCTSLAAVITALQSRPVIAGVKWYDSFDRPESNGLCPLTPGASVRGGHELCLVGVDVDAQVIRFANSWSTGWGDNGYGMWTWHTFDDLLHQQGDVTVLI